jgi:mono/diheme cytochrome c family protein
MSLSFRGGAVRIIVALIILCSLGLAILYHYVISGGLRARQTPPALETFVAQGLLEMSIPNEAKELKNPLSLSVSGTDVTAGRELYQKNCEVCHGYDGRGKTAAGGGLYPPPLDLRPTALVRRKRTDGELFYFIRNGIRNTGMPGWQMPDQRIWQLVAFIRNLRETIPVEIPIAATDAKLHHAHYVGSSACNTIFN